MGCKPRKKAKRTFEETIEEGLHQLLSAFIKRVSPQLRAGARSAEITFTIEDSGGALCAHLGELPMFTIHSVERVVHKFSGADEFLLADDRKLNDAGDRIAKLEEQLADVTKTQLED